MRVLFVSTIDPKSQGDLLEVSILHGLREVLGENCVDFPRKKVMYHDWSSTKKEDLHGRGFTLYKKPIKDLSKKQRELKNFDYVIYGVSNAYDQQEIKEVNDLVSEENIWHLDGHDLYGHAPRMINFQGENIIGVQKNNSFKRELVENVKNVHPTGFGIPEYQIRKIDFSKKTQLYQKTAPDSALFKEVQDLGGGRAHHIFTDEDDYYEDLSKSWIGLTCKKGGWDCLRHYEIIAAGTLLLFKDYDLKPQFCSPTFMPCLSYSTKEELDIITKQLVVDNQPSSLYLSLIDQQRKWLLNNATTKSRANNILNILQREWKK